MNEYEYEYYLQKTYSTNINMNIILDILCHKYERIHSNIRIYLTFENDQTQGYCYIPVWRLCIRYQKCSVTFNMANNDKYFMKNSSYCLFFTVIGEFRV